MRGVFWVVAIQRIGVGEDGGGLLKRDAMFLELAMAFGMSHVNTLSYIHQLPGCRKTEGVGTSGGTGTL